MRKQQGLRHTGSKALTAGTLTLCCVTSPRMPDSAAREPWRSPGERLSTRAKNCGHIGPRPCSLLVTLDQVVNDPAESLLVIIYVAEIDNGRVRASEIYKFNELSMIVHGEAMYGAPLPAHEIALEAETHGS